MSKWKVYQDPQFPRGDTLMGYKGKSKLATGRILSAFASSRITNERLSEENLDIITSIGSLDEGSSDSLYLRLAYPPIQPGSVLVSTATGGHVVLDDRAGRLIVRDSDAPVGEINYRTGQVRVSRAWFVAAKGLLVSYDWTSE